MSRCTYQVVRYHYRGASEPVSQHRSLAAARRAAARRTRGSTDSFFVDRVCSVFFCTHGSSKKVRCRKIEQ